MISLYIDKDLVLQEEKKGKIRLKAPRNGGC